MEMSSEDIDQTLIQRVARSDKQAMRSLYERYHDSLLSFLRARGADDATAADTVHEAMLEVWRSAHRYAGKASVKTWMFTIARNKLVDRFRKSARLSFVDEVPDSQDTQPDPEAISIAASDAKRLRGCLDRLKPAHLSVIRLAFFEDLSYDEIADIEEIPKGTVKTRVFHAKQLLLRCLGQR